VSDWFDEELAAELVKAAPAEIQETPAGTDLIEKKVDQLFEETCNVVSAAMAFADIEPGATECPEEWIEQFGEEEARRRFRIAQYAQMSHKEAPFALDMATKMAVALGRCKLDKKAPQGQINIAVVKYEESRPKFREIEVEDGVQYGRRRR
jgi:hypothetical protein